MSEVGDVQLNTIAEALIRIEQHLANIADLMLEARNAKR